MAAELPDPGRKDPHAEPSNAPKRARKALPVDLAEEAIRRIALLPPTVRACISGADFDALHGAVRRWLRAEGRVHADQLSLDIKHGLAVLTLSDGTILFNRSLGDLASSVLRGRRFGLGGYFEHFSQLVSRCETILDRRDTTPGLLAAVEASWWFDEVFPDKRTVRAELTELQKSLYPKGFTASRPIVRTNGRNYALFTLLAHAARQALEQGQPPAVGIKTLASKLRELREHRTDEGLTIDGVTVKAPQEQLASLKRKVTAGIIADEAGLVQVGVARHIASATPDEDRSKIALPEDLVSRFGVSRFPLSTLVELVSSIAQEDGPPEALRHRLRYTEAAWRLSPEAADISPLIQLAVALLYDQDGDRIDDTAELYRQLDECTRQVYRSRISCGLSPRERLMVCAVAGSRFAEVVSSAREGLRREFANSEISLPCDDGLAIKSAYSLLDAITTTVTRLRIPLGELHLNEGIPSAKIQAPYQNFLDAICELATVLERPEIVSLRKALEEIGTPSLREITMILEPSSAYSLPLGERIWLGSNDGSHEVTAENPRQLEALLRGGFPRGNVLTRNGNWKPTRITLDSPLGPLTQYCAHPSLMGCPEKGKQLPTLADLIPALNSEDLIKIIARGQLYYHEATTTLHRMMLPTHAESLILDGLTVPAAVLVASLSRPFTRKASFKGFPKAVAQAHSDQDLFNFTIMAAIELLPVGKLPEAIASLKENRPMLSRISPDVDGINELVESYLTLLELRVMASERAR